MSTPVGLPQPVPQSLADLLKSKQDPNEAISELFSQAIKGQLPTAK